MALAIRSCFSSCLSSDFHCWRVVRHPEGQYKIVKALDPILDAIGEIAKASDASEGTLVGISYARTSVQVLRDILSVFHIFSHVIPSLIWSLKLFFELVKGVCGKQDVPLNQFKRQSQLDYNEIAKGRVEKAFALGAVAAKTIKGGSATFRFLSSPFSLTAKTHQAALVIEHSSAVLGHGLEMGYQHIAFHRALGEGASHASTYTIYAKRMCELTVALLEKILQVIFSLAKIFDTTLPPGFRLPIAFSIAGLGLYRVWQKTE